MIVDAHAHIFSHVCRKVAPPQYPEGRFPAECLLREMDQAGVDRAVIVQNPTIGTINDEVRGATESWPERFAGAMQVDPLDPEAPEVIRRLASPRMCALKLEMSEEWGWSGIHPGLRLDAAALRPVWETVAELDLRVIIDPGAIGNPGYQVEELDRLSDAYGDVSFLIEHLGYLQKPDRERPDARQRRLELIVLAAKPNVYLGFSATAILLGEDFPCPEARQLLREAVDLVGASKILWGSDVPLTLGRYSYRQMVDVVGSDECGLSELDRGLILGGNAARLFFSSDK